MTSFSSGGAPHRGKGIGFDGGVFQKNCRLGGAPPAMPSTMGNPDDDDNDDYYMMMLNNEDSKEF